MSLLHMSLQAKTNDFAKKRSRVNKVQMPCNENATTRQSIREPAFGMFAKRFQVHTN